MTPDRSLHREDGEDIEGLAHRARIILPEVIKPDGSASPHQVAVVPPGVDLAKTFLPYRELPGPPTAGPGAAIVGTREPEIGPYLPGFGSAVADVGPHPHITRPQNSDAILAWLYDITGIRYAPAALWRVAGWEIGWVAHWLDRLYAGGLMGELIVAERQAAAAVRAAWVASQSGSESGSVVAASGVMLAARAVIDVLAAFDRVIEDALGDREVRVGRAAIDDARAAILQRLRSFIRALEDAGRDRVPTCDRHAKVAAALHHARDLVDAIGLFTAVGDPIEKRVIRITEALPTKGRKPPPLTAAFPDELSDLTVRLERMISAASIPTAPDRWCETTTGDLSRLHDANAQARMTALARFRTDLIYKLIVTRRLDRLFEVLPWMLAPSGAFRLTFGGPLGAMASLYEVARHREIAVELVSRSYDPGSGDLLDTRRGRTIYGDPTAVQHAVANAHRAGFWLATSALSHHMVKAFLAGEPFDAAHPLPTLQAGRLGWTFEDAMSDPATKATVTETELAKAIYQTADYHRDLARYMGQTAADVLTVALTDIFSGDFRDPGFNLFMKLADDRRRKLKIADNPVDANSSGAPNRELLQVKIGDNPFGANSSGAAHRELLRSILKSTDQPTDGNDDDWRSDPIVTRTGARELYRFDHRNIGHNGDRESSGSRIGRRAVTIRERQGDPGRELRCRVDLARSWTRDSKDQPLADILSGRERLPGLTPVAQTGIVALWFRPDIDAPIHDWIATGAPLHHPLALSNIAHARLIAQEVHTVRTAMPLLFGMPIPPSLRRRILVPLWTGVAGITADHAHVR